MRSRFAFGMAKGEKMPEKAKAGEIKFLCFSCWFALDSYCFPVSSDYLGYATGSKSSPQRHTLSVRVP